MSGEPADRAHNLRIEAEFTHAPLRRCGICGCLLAFDDGEFHRDFHHRHDHQPFHASTDWPRHFVLLELDSGDWIAKTSDGALLRNPESGVHVDWAEVADTPVAALRALIWKVVGRL